MGAHLLAAMAVTLCLAPVQADGGSLFPPKLSWMPGDPASPVVVEPGRNILDNSSFEQGTGGWSASGSEFCDREPDAAVAWHGAQSLRLFSTKETADAITLCSPVFRAQAGAEYSVSCYARASGPGAAIDISLCATTFAHQVATAAEVGTDWRRVAATGKLGDTRRQTYFVLISVSGLRKGVDVWIDAVQAERGPLTAYKPSRELELGAVTDRFANTYHYGEPIVLRPSVANWGTEARRCEITYSLRDYLGAEVRHGSLQVDAPPGRTTRAELPVGADWRGYGQAILDLTVPGQEGSARYRCHFATIPKRTSMGFAANPFFGVHGSGQFARNWDLLEGIGCQTAKIYCGWGDKQKDKPYNFAGLDAAVEALLSHHIVPIVCFGTWAPGWAQLTKPDGTPTGELDVEAFKQHIAECVTHLKNVRLFESWNEIYFRGTTPNTLELMWAAAEVCKRLRPDAVMMTNAVGGGGDTTLFLRALLKARQGRPLDALSLHYPWDGFRESPERGHMRECVAETRRLGEQSAGRPLDLYITESGFHGGEGMHARGMAVMESDWVEDIQCTPRQKPQWMVEQFLIAMENRVKALCEFDWCGYPVGPVWYSSLTFNDMSPTAALPAYAVMTNMLSGARIVRALPAGRCPVRGLIFRRGGDSFTCLWSAAGDVLMPARAAEKSLRVTDVVGAQRSVPVRAGVAVLRLSDGPIYVPGVVDKFTEPLVISRAAPAPWIEGHEYEVAAEVTNPFPAPWRVVLRPALEAGWRASPEQEAVTVPANGKRTAAFRLSPAGGNIGVIYKIEARADEGTFTAEAKADTVSAESLAAAEKSPVATVDDFEAGVGPWKTQCGEGAVATIETADEPAHGGGKSLHLHLVHGPPLGTWADTYLAYDAPRKWSAYEGLTFWVYWKERPNCGLQVHLGEQEGGTYYATVDLGDKPNEWRRVVVPFRDFFFGGWTHDPDNRLDPDHIRLLALVGVGTAGPTDLWVDDIQLWRKLPPAPAP